MRIFKVLVSHEWDKCIAVVVANNETEAELIFPHTYDVEEIFGLVFDPTVERKPVVFDAAGKPIDNVLMYEWFPDN